MFQPVEDGGLATAVQPNHHTMVASTAAQAHQARHETLLPDGGAHDQDDQGQLRLPHLNLLRTKFLFSNLDQQAQAAARPASSTHGAELRPVPQLSFYLPAPPLLHHHHQHQH